MYFLSIFLYDKIFLFLTIGHGNSTTSGIKCGDSLDTLIKTRPLPASCYFPTECTGGMKEADKEDCRLATKCICMYLIFFNIFRPRYDIPRDVGYKLLLSRNPIDVGKNHFVTNLTRLCLSTNLFYLSFS